MTNTQLKKKFEKKFPYKGIIIEDDGTYYSLNDIWSFIHSALEEQRKEIEREVIEKLKAKQEEVADRDFDWGMRWAIKMVKELSHKKETKK